MRVPCDFDVVVIECLWYLNLPAAWQTYPHPGFLEIAAVWVWRRMVNHANDGHLLPRSLRE